MINCLLSPPSPSEVIRVIACFKHTDATGVDGITVSVLQLVASIIAMPMAHLIALLLAQAKIPSAFKQPRWSPSTKEKERMLTSPPPIDQWPSSQLCPRSLRR